MYGSVKRARRSHVVEAPVEDIHAAVVEVGRVETVTTRRRGDREALVDRAVGVRDRNHRGGRQDGGIPAEDLAVFGREDERRGCRLRAVLDDEARARVGHEARRSVRHVDRQRNLASVSAIQRADAGSVVGDPPGRRRQRREAPGVHEIRIDARRDSRLVRHQVRHQERVPVRCGGRGDQDGSHEDRGRRQCCGAQVLAPVEAGFPIPPPLLKPGFGP